MKGSVSRAITKLIKDIDENPFCFFKERDIHSILYNNLLKEFPKNYKFKPSTKNYWTPLVHGEYFGSKKNERVDMVIFSPNDVKHIKYTSLTKEKDDKKKLFYKPLNLKAAIEIKVNSGSHGPKIDDLVKEDLKKLINLRDSRKENKRMQLHFIYILRWSTTDLKTQKREKKRIIDFKELCRKSNIKFHYNKKNHFPNMK